MTRQVDAPRIARLSCLCANRSAGKLEAHERGRSVSALAGARNKVTGSAILATTYLVSASGHVRWRRLRPGVRGFKNDVQASTSRQNVSHARDGNRARHKRGPVCNAGHLSAVAGGEDCQSLQRPRPSARPDRKRALPAAGGSALPPGRHPERFRYAPHSTMRAARRLMTCAGVAPDVALIVAHIRQQFCAQIGSSRLANLQYSAVTLPRVRDREPTRAIISA
jgi:hypothetical protein